MKNKITYKVIAYHINEFQTLYATTDNFQEAMAYTTDSRKWDAVIIEKVEKNLFKTTKEIIFKKENY